MDDQEPVILPFKPIDRTPSLSYIEAVDRYFTELGNEKDKPCLKLYKP